MIPPPGPPDPATTAHIQMLNEHERRIVRLEAKVEMLETANSRLEDELKVYQASSIAMSRKMDTILHALVGDDSTRTTGIMQRLESIEGVTNFVKELKWKAMGALIVLGWAWAFGSWAIDKLLK